MIKLSKPLLLLMPFLIVPFSGAMALDFKKDCSDVLETEVTAKTELRSDESLDSSRSRLMLQASKTALMQTIGNKISAKSTYKLEGTNKTIDEKMLNRISAQSAGFVVQQIISENQVTEAGRNVLVANISARVCVPKKASIIKSIVRITDVKNLVNESAPEFISILTDTFSGSQQFLVSLDVDEEPDYEIRAAITHVEWTTINTQNSSSNSPAPYYKLSVSVDVFANRTSDGSVTSIKLDEYKNFKDISNPEALTLDYMRIVLKKAAGQLQDKINVANAHDMSIGSVKGMVNSKTDEW